MGANSNIAWTHHTFNPWWGCVKISEGCKNCYAEKHDARFAGDDPHWGAKASRRFFGEKHWNAPARWNRLAGEKGERHRVFVASMSDIFELHTNPTINVEMAIARHKLWRIIEQTPHLDWLLLTKRPENSDLAPDSWDHSPPGNVWLGVTAENQKQADIRIPLLLNYPWPAVRFVSHEPALGPIDIRRYLWPTHRYWPSKYRSWEDAKAAGAIVGRRPQALLLAGARLVDWVITGAESALDPRPMDEQWVREMRDQCADSETPFFYKQRIDEWNFKVSTPFLDGAKHVEFPQPRRRGDDG